jgi:predicted DNA binding CopG/RHH family protein
MQNPEENSQEQQEEVQDESPQMFSKEDANKLAQTMVTERLQRERNIFAKKEAQLNARISELEAKTKAGTATPAEQVEHATGQAAQAQAYQQGIPADQIPILVEREMTRASFKQKLDDALSKDEEFRKLAETGNPIPPEAMEAMTHLDNAPAVIKHLLKDKKDYQVAKLSASAGVLEYTKFINELSTRLESTASKPRPSPYSHVPNLSDVGESDQDWDMENYIKGKF